MTGGETGNGRACVLPLSTHPLIRSGKADPTAALESALAPTTSRRCPKPQRPGGRGLSGQSGRGEPGQSSPDDYQETATTVARVIEDMQFASCPALGQA